MSQSKCPNCNSSLLMDYNISKTIDIRDKGKVTGRFEYTQCMTCKSEFVIPDQAKYNEKEFLPR